MATKLRIKRFTPVEWRVFGGAKGFEDGSEPWYVIGDGGDWTFIGDREGLEAVVCAAGPDAHPTVWTYRFNRSVTARMCQAIMEGCLVAFDEPGAVLVELGFHRL